MAARTVIALLIGGLAFLAVVLPVAWIINTQDWGVVMIFPAFFLVYGLMMLARRLEDWVRRDPRRRDRQPRS